MTILETFLLLDELFPGEEGKDRKIVSGAAHDEIWLDIDYEQAGQLSIINVIELTRCGVMFNTDNDTIMMFP